MAPLASIEGTRSSSNTSTFGVTFDSFEELAEFMKSSLIWFNKKEGTSRNGIYNSLLTSSARNQDKYLHKLSDSSN